MTITLKIDAETTARIDALATRTGQDKATILRHLVANGIEDLEDYCRAVEVRDRVERGEECTYTVAEVRADLGLDVGNRRDVYRRR